MLSTFPVSLNLKDRPCLIIGGGSIAANRVEQLSAAGAHVTLVHPRLTPALRKQREGGQIKHLSRSFRLKDIQGMVLVLNTLKTKPELSRALLRLATREGFLLNSHDQPLYSNFIMPAIVQRGHLQIGITTGGASPSISKRLREDLEELFDGEFTAFLDWLARMRRDLLKSDLPLKKRIALLRKVTRDFTLSGKIRYPKAWR